MGSSSSHPSDLAEVVFHELRRRYGGACPSLEVLTDLFESMYFASLGTEEGEPIRFSVVYLDPANPDPQPPAHPAPDRWTSVRFGAPLPATIPNLVKLALASDPRFSAFALYHDADGRVFVWGLVELGSRQDDYLTHAADWAYDPPGLFQAAIVGTGSVAASIGYDRIGELKLNAMRSMQHDVLAEGPIRDSLQPGIRAFLAAIRGALPRGVYERRADREASLTGEWLSAFSRLLLGVYRLRHGGAVLITPGASRRGLDVKYEIGYGRLRSALQAEALVRIRQTDVRGRIAGEYLERNADAIPVELYREEGACARQGEKQQNELAGTIRFISLLTRVDGLVLMDHHLGVHGFGVMIGPGRDPAEVYLAGDSRATPGELRGVDANHFGSRHRSMMRYCAENPGSVGFVFSADGGVRAMTEVGGRVVMWEPIRLVRYRYLTR